MRQNTFPPVVVIGAGIGGLSAAIRLAQRGRRVIVLEQNAWVGGKMGEVVQDGFRWDTGPSVITMRTVLEDLFAAAGRRLEDYLSLLPVEPLTRYFYPDQTVLDMSRDLPRTAAQIAALDQGDVEGYLAFLSMAARLHRITAPVFTYGPPPSWRSLGLVSPREALSVDPFSTLDAAVRRKVRSPYLRQLLNRFATYVGSNPYQAPATLAVIAHVELTEGVWYPRGGVYAIARALESLAVEVGVEIRTQSPVRRIEVDAGRAQGVVLEDGARLPASAVIANVDVAQVYESLLPAARVTPVSLARQARSPSCSGFALLLGVEGLYPQLAHHNIVFSSNYPLEFEQIFRQGIPPTEPTVYVAITSKTDPTHAPAGCENWFVLVNAPPLGAQFDWQTQARPYRHRVLAQLAARGWDIRRRIRVEKWITPEHLARMTGAQRGALYGMSFNDRLAPFRRPSNRAAGIAGLFFAGGSTHPGGGVPMVMLSGKNAAEMTAAYLTRVGEDR